ncbi:hypothetical protein [Phreatobacter sp. AB_2022a]|uniref:hypothetical protein n=1 Tax=Phreatobacter sp. AB_2022a TaxID=3003134 RepID=UPI00228761A7|nr:hypothetical protein [Phreatobacter sp. AB_2022a]MCZ0737614.1 hypothetical protein [Phreatobacter sp. AB_2022a]
MNPMAVVERLARAATPLRLALALAAVLAAFLVNAYANAGVEALLRGSCGGLDCLKQVRPEARHAGYTAEDFRAFLTTIGPRRSEALAALLTDLPLAVATAAALLTGAGLASRGLPLSQRTFRLLFLVPAGFLTADLVEDGLLALAYSGLADASPVLPWTSALKFALLAASAVSSLVLALAGAALAPPAD